MNTEGYNMNARQFGKEESNKTALIDCLKDMDAHRLRFFFYYYSEFINEYEGYL